MDDTTLKIIVPIITFILGFAASRLTMSKKERFDKQTKTLEISNQLDTDITAAFQEYQKALGKFINAERRTLSEFLEVESAGVTYFQALNNAASAVLSGILAHESFKHTHLPKVRDGYYRAIPKHYETLKHIVEQCGLEYSGKFKVENYQTIHNALEKYA
ncbi:hypothetical protein JKP11_21760 [Vibrio vulnificus]|uniref:hypothetical protein n=1 Tax=Vibrio vulnificus TaxID=672 RepID=UPI001CDBBBE0|nr:hypothetical protein [Vibrio vulnificus]MCA3958262.1 hypothetical protein [Vibrio vulnificus]